MRSPPPSKGGGALDPPHADVFGRFDLALTALLDEAYQSADQRYRNWCKVLAGVFSVIIALLAGAALASPNFRIGSVVGGLAGKPIAYWFHPGMWAALVCGILATPLAPVAKDLTSAIQAGVDVVQRIQKH